MIEIRSIDPRAALGPGNVRRVEVRLVSMFNTLSIESYARERLPLLDFASVVNRFPSTKNIQEFSSFPRCPKIEPQKTPTS